MLIDPFAFRSLSSLTELEKTLSGLHRPLSPSVQAAFSGTMTTPLTASMRTIRDAARSHDTVFGKQLSMLDTISQHMAQTHPWHGTSFQHYSNVGSKSPMVSALSDIIRQSAPYAGALEMAGKLGPLGITGLLEQHRLGASALAEQLVLTGQISTALGNPAVFGTFDAMSAASQMLKQAGAFGLESNDTLKLLMTGPVVGGFGLRDYGLLLDAAGLNLPRWPRFRPLTSAEQSERQRRRIAKYRQPPHVTRAKSFVHQHESYLREAIDELMVTEYGDDWAEERLPKCGQAGSALLGKLRRWGGMPLDHADYAHYREIIIQDDHFESIFSVAFSDPGVVASLIDRARTLRAASHHPGHEFTKEDLRELRLTWSAIKAAFRRLQEGLMWEGVAH